MSIRQRPFLNDASYNFEEPENELQSGDIDSSRTTLLRDKTAKMSFNNRQFAEIDDIVKALISMDDSSIWQYSRDCESHITPWWSITSRDGDGTLCGASTTTNQSSPDDHDRGTRFVVCSAESFSIVVQ